MANTGTIRVSTLKLFDKWLLQQLDIQTYAKENRGLIIRAFGAGIDAATIGKVSTKSVYNFGVSINSGINSILGVPG